jgi:glucose/arabinose dehydrogenase
LEAKEHCRTLPQHRFFLMSIRWISALVASLLVLGSLDGYAQPYGLTNPVPVGAFLNGVLPSSAPNSGATFDVEVAYTNLSAFNLPIYMTAHPLTNAIVLIEKNGRIRMFPNRRNVTDAEVTTILDLTAKVFTVSDSGMTGIAFHPQFGQAGSTNRGFVYITYKWRPNPDGGANADYSFWRLSRFNVPDGQFTIDPNSETILVQQFDQQEFHDAGCMMFGPDSYLYFSCGDEGGADDQYHASQKLNERLMSGIFRVDVNMNPATSHPVRRQPFQHPAQPPTWPLSYTSNYFVPNDNPFLDPGGSVLEEYFALGLRNPYRFSRDPVTGMIWVGDVGQAAREEVNILQKGANYQWAYMEGTIAGPLATPTNIIGTPKPPLWEYDHSSGNGCVIGGFVYRGTNFAELTGKYIWPDNVSGRVWALSVDSNTNVLSVDQIATMPSGSVYGGTSSCGLDQSGEIYFVKIGGVGSGLIYKIKRVTAAVPDPPALLSQLGVFTNLATLTPTNTLIPYAVNSPLWSDRAAKLRWLAVPNDGSYNSSTEQIVFSPTNSWQFPKGTVLVKQFLLPINDTNSALLKRLETRFIVLDNSGGVYGVTYKWRDDDSDADLLVTGTNEDYLITGANGLTRTQTWIFPSRQDCLTCHNANAGYVLGVRTHQLNCAQTYPQTGITDNQLRTLGHLGLLGTNYSEALLPSYLQSCSVTNTSFSLETRVRSYIDSNCSQCHRPGGAYANFDARFTTPLDGQGLIYGAVNSFLNDSNDRVVVPGDLTHSLLYNRANRTDAYEMPPLAKNLVDTNAVTTMAAWINSLPPGPGVALTTPASTVLGDFSVTATFTVPVTGLTSNLFTISNGTISSLTGSGANYTLTISPGAPGQVTIQLPAGRVQDGSGHLNYASNPLSVTLLPGPMLLHRWSFNGDANDSVGGANATLNGTASIANNQLQLPGGGPLANFAFVDIGSTLSTNASLTVEEWMTINTLTTWSKTWMFGYNDPAGEPTLSYINFTPQTGPGPPKVDFDTGITGEMNTLGGTDPAPLVTAHEYHVVVTYDALNNLMSMYLDGVFADSASMGGYNITQLGFNTGRFGCGYYFGDPDFNGSINELRIYSGALSASDVANDFAAGPNTLVQPGTFVPKLSSMPDVAIPVNGSTGALPFTITNGPIPISSLTLSSTSSDTSLVPPGNIVFGGSGTNRTVTVTPASGLQGSAVITITVSNAQVSSSTSFTLTVGSPTLVARYAFDGDASDSSGNGNNGTLTGNPPFVAGRIGTQAISFNGVNQYATVPISVRTNFTVAFWVNTTASTTGTVWTTGLGMISADVAGVANDFGISLMVNGQVGFGVGNPNTSLASIASINDGNWHHVAVTRTSSTGLMEIYVDGVLNPTTNGPTAARTAPNAIRIGGILSGGGFFPGIIDEVRIYNTVLSAAEINALANPPIAPAITSFSGSATNYFGSSGQTFTVVASGTVPLSYQWLHAGTNLTGQTTTSLLIPNPSVADTGAYRVVVSNSVGTVTSPIANLTLLLTSLKHRWSFSDLTDSIGGANATLVGSASLSGGSLQLPGGGTFANYASINISNTLAINPSISVEVWVTLNALQNWSKVWMFGQDGTGEPTLSYINFTPRTGVAGNPPKLDFDPSNDVEFNTTGGANSPALVTGHEYHAVAVYDSGFNLMTLYIDGFPVDTGSMGQHNIEQLGFNTGRFGCGYFFSDPDLTGSIDELRVYAGVMTANDVANSFQAGPNTLITLGSTPQIKVSIFLSGSQPILSWPIGILEQADQILGPWSSVPNATSPYSPVGFASKKFYRVRIN